MIKFVKFFFTWVLTYWINIGFTYIFIKYFLFTKDISYLISISIVTLINFVLSLIFIFENKYSHSLLIRYIIALTLFSTLNYTLVYYIKFIFPLNYYILIFLVTTFIFFFKFIVYDKYVFKKNKN